MNAVLPRPLPERLLLLCAALCVTACASAPPPAQEPQKHPFVFGDPGQFGTKPDIPGPAEIHELRRPQREAFLNYLDAHADARVPLNRRVSEYLQQITQGFDYQGDTLMAADALALDHGNCLSLAIVTTALAKLAGVEIGYQLADDAPVFQLNGNMVTRGLHVRSILYEKDWQEQEGMFLFSRPGIVIDYFPTNGSRFIGNLSQNEYLAMYYRNIAAEAIEKEHYRNAYWYALESLRFAPGHSAALNMLAVIYGRVGDVRKAEAIYLHGLEFSDEKLSLLKNYRSLLLRAGRDKEASAIEERLARIDDPSFFHWLQLARSAYGEAEYALAIGYYRRALELAPYLHEGHLGLAQAYYQAGRLQSAEAALKDALDNAYRKSTRSLYQAKLEALSQEMYN